MSTRIEVKISLLRQDALAPRYMSDGAAGADMFACCEAPITIAPGQRCAVPCGFAMELPPGYEGQVRPRSGLALKNGISVVNAPGTIDQDYRGEIKAILINLGTEPFVIATGDRIAQLIVAPVLHADFCAHEELSLSERGAGGFGSTGQRKA